MRRIDSIEDEMQDVATYEFDNGERLRIEGGAVRELGIAAVLRDLGYLHLLPTERLPVRQHGRIVGTMAPDFDPLAIKSTSWLYGPRPGDFKRVGDEWVAVNNLGPGDFDAIPGFMRRQDEG